ATTTVSVQRDLLQQQLLQRVQLALLDGGEEALCELPLLLRPGFEAWPPLVDARTRTHRQLAASGLGLPDDARDLRIVVVEDVPQEEHGALLGRQRLEHDQESHPDRFPELGATPDLVARA